MKRRFAKTAAAVLGTLAVGEIGSRLAWGRSLAATDMELGIRAIGMKKRFDTPEHAEEYMAERAKVTGEPVEVPAIMAKHYGAVSETVDGMQVIVFNKNAEGKRTVIYIHGGGYVNQITNLHLRMLGRIAKQADCTIAVPIYPLAPEHTYRETYDFMTGYYAWMQEKTSGHVILMGDSAGGGFVIAFCEYLAKIGLPQPEKLIALSPWLDAAMKNPLIPLYDRSDPMLGVGGAAAIAQKWAGELDIEDYRISPMNGDLSVLENIHIFVGTREVFYPDILLFFKKLNAAGKGGNLYVGQGMNHVYPCLPIPEGEKAIRQIVSIINA